MVSTCAETPVSSRYITNSDRDSTKLHTDRHTPAKRLQTANTGLLTYYIGSTIRNADSNEMSFVVPADAKPGDTIHMVVEVQDNGAHTLKHYQRVIITVK